MLPLQLSSASPGPLQDEGWEHAGPAGDAGRKHWYRKGGPPAEAEHAGCTCRAACPARSSSTSRRRTHLRRPKRMTPAGRSILATRLPPTTRSDRCFSACERGPASKGHAPVTCAERAARPVPAPCRAARPASQLEQALPDVQRLQTRGYAGGTCASSPQNPGAQRGTSLPSGLTSSAVRSSI